MFAPKFAALCLFLHAALAMPGPYHVHSTRQLTGIPAHATKLALDEGRGMIVAFAGDELLGEMPAPTVALGRRQDPGTCTQISGADVQQLPGWQTLHDAAVSSWGDGWDTVDANPAAYPQYGATLCVDGNVAQITLDADPTCTTQSEETGGTLAGTDGTAALSTMQGTTMMTQTTVTQAVALAAGFSISAKVGIPDFGDLTSTFTSSVTITNTDATSNSFTSSNTQTQTVTLNAPAGQTCSLTFSSQTCNATGKGQQRMLASGWVWFYYGSTRDGHYKWALSIDGTITDPEQRAEYIGFTTSSSSNTLSQYNGTCM